MNQQKLKISSALDDLKYTAYIIFSLILLPSILLSAAAIGLLSLF